MNIISFLSPTNLAEQKHLFFSSTVTNPQLEYDWNLQELEAWLKKEPEYVDFSKAVLNQDAKAIKEQGEKVFSTTMDEHCLLEAKNLVSTPPKKLKSAPIEDIIIAFQEAFNYFDLNYSLEISDSHGFNFRPLQKEKKIVVSKYLNLDFFSVDGEVKHELLHLIRYENTIYNKIPFSSNYLPTEEGLSTYFQDYTGTEGASSLFQHAAEYLITEISLNGSFTDTFNFLKDIGFSSELAWQRAIRHKFGLRDTSQVGDNMKPSMYFYWQQKIKSISDVEKLRLLVGKIRLDELVNYGEYSGVLEKEKLVEFYKLST